MGPHTHDELFLMLGRLEGKMDSMLLCQQALLRKSDEQDRRLGGLDKSRAWLWGYATAVAGGFALLGKIWH